MGEFAIFKINFHAETIILKAAVTQALEFYPSRWTSDRKRKKNVYEESAKRPFNHNYKRVPIILPIR